MRNVFESANILRRQNRIFIMRQVKYRKATVALQHFEAALFRRGYLRRP
jgi:hypothetical protein